MTQQPVEAVAVPATHKPEELITALYSELRALAKSYRRFSSGLTMQTTGLVHEAYLRVANRDWDSRAHFFAVAAKAMRQIIIDNSRRNRRRHINGSVRVTLSEVTAPIDDVVTGALTLSEALADLSELDERKSTLLELRFLGGLTVDEIAKMQGVSVSTVQRDLRFARAWLRGQLRREQPV